MRESFEYCLDKLKRRVTRFHFLKIFSIIISLLVKEKKNVKYN